MLRPFMSQQRTLLTEGVAADWTRKLAAAGVGSLVSRQISSVLKCYVALLTDVRLVLSVNNPV